MVSVISKSRHAFAGNPKQLALIEPF